MKLFYTIQSTQNTGILTLLEQAVSRKRQYQRLAKALE